jgi:para-aminobenzoate synthetase component I
LRTSLPYNPDSATLFEALLEEPWAVFLDSCGMGRYDILAADPMATVVTRGGATEVHTRTDIRIVAGDPFRVLRDMLKPYATHPGDTPFAGGAIGYFGYDLGRRIERLPESAADREHLPWMAFGIYDWAVVVDQQARKSWLAGAGRDIRTRARWDGLAGSLASHAASSAGKPFRVLEPPVSNFSPDAYRDAFRRIMDYIRAGDCYQVNLAQRLSCKAEGDDWAAYRALRRLSPAPCSAYLRLPFCHVLSSSPERFLEVRSGRVHTHPIKGTRPRDADPVRDASLASELLNSPKDRAENLMIVDLLRNDLGRVCEPGSIAVDRLFEVESYAYVHHLVSTVSGRLAKGRDALDLVRAAFPGGSITGAPKLRAMQIIEELEPDRRGVYCGAIGYIGFDGDMDLNIAIRTLVNAGGVMRFSAGGGIVADSDADSEYRETLDKADALLRLLESFRS